MVRDAALQVDAARVQDMSYTWKVVRSGRGAGA
jgi:hypothetical protein